MKHPERYARETAPEMKHSGGGANHQRSSNLELYRILVMLLIVAHHYVVNSGLTDPGGAIYSDPMRARSLFLLIFGAWGKTGINCFVLITGYFMCKSRITARKFVKLLFEVVFYKLAFYCVFLFSGYEPFSLKRLVETILPVARVTNNFSGCFLWFYLCIPFLNALIQHITRRQHLKLILLVSMIYVFYGTVPMLDVTMNYTSWFCVLYIIASYIRLYPGARTERCAFWGWMALASMLLSVASVIGCAWVGKRVGRDMAHYFVSDSNNLLAVLNGVSLFLFFKNLKIRQSRWINAVASSTFGVLMIHANCDAMRRWLWKDVLNNVGAYASPLLPLHAVGSVLAVFTICTCIDQVRIHLIEKPFFKLWDRCWPGVREKCAALEDRVCARLGIT